MSHVNHVGKFVSEKVAAIDIPLCKGRCRLECNSRISNEARQKLFDSFYLLNSTAQDVHLFQCISSSKPKIQLVDACNHRQVTLSYSVIVDGSRLKVCKTAFHHLFAIKIGKIDHIVAQHKAGLTTAHPSKRGKHDVRPNKGSEDRVEFVRAHIRSYPVSQSHYTVVNATQTVCICLQH